MTEESSAGTLRVLVLDDEGRRTKAINTLMEGAAGLELLVSPLGADEGIKAAKQSRPGVIVIVAEPAVPLEAIEALSTAMPEVPVLALLDTVRLEAERDCLLAGARLCLTELGSREEFVGTLRRLHAQEKRRVTRLTAAAIEPYEQKLGQVIAVHSAKGGAGTTTIATNLAVVLHRSTKKKVAIVDANLQSGDVGVLLDVFSGNNIADLLPHLKELDEELLNEVMVAHGSGIKVLLAPSMLEQADAVKADQITRILAALRKVYGYIIVDTSPLLDPITISALDNADTILAVTTPDMQSLRNAARFLRLARQFGYSEDKVKLVVNRSNAAEAISANDIQQNLQHKIAVSIHADGAKAARAANRGEPLVLLDSRNVVSRDIRGLASALTGTKVKAEDLAPASPPTKQPADTEAAADEATKKPRLLPF